MTTKTRTREEYEAAAAAASSPQALKRAIAAMQSYTREYGPREWFNRRDGHSEACTAHIVTKTYGSGRYSYSYQQTEHDPDGDCCFLAELARWYTSVAAWNGYER